MHLNYVRHPRILLGSMASASSIPVTQRCFTKTHYICTSGVNIANSFTFRETPAEYDRQLHVSEGQFVKIPMINHEQRTWKYESN